MSSGSIDDYCNMQYNCNMKNKASTYRLTDYARRKIDKYARATGLSRTDIVELAIRMFRYPLEDTETKGEKSEGEEERIR